MEFNSVLCYTPNAYDVRDKDLVKQYLFNGNTNEGVGYKGVLVGFATTGYYLDFTVFKNVKIFACGHAYDNHCFGNATISKWNGSKFETYKLAPTNYDGTWYEFVTLPKGRYKLTNDGGNWVNFDEWRLEIDR